MFASQPLSGKDILLWDDIQAAFDNAVIPVRSRIVVLLFLNGPAFKSNYSKYLSHFAAHGFISLQLGFGRLVVDNTILS